MKPGKIEIAKPQSATLWKYFDLHRFIYFLNEKKLFFTRLDKFEDPFEGVATRLLRRDAKYAKVPKSFDEFTKNISKKEQAQLLREKKLHDYVKKQEISISQTRQYINCWFSGDRESMAMWNLYSNADSVALKISFDNLESCIKSVFENFIEENGNRVSIIGDSVQYLRLNPFDEKLPKQLVRYSSLKKDVSYDYENEYRFLIYTIKNLDKVQDFYAIPLNIDELQLTVITHPNMEDWKFKNIETLIEISKSKLRLEKSSTLLRNKN